MACGSIAAWQSKPVDRHRFFVDYASQMYHPDDAVDMAGGLEELSEADHLTAEEVEFLRWRAERWMKLRHLPAVLFHSPWFTLCNAIKMMGHIFRGATIKSFLGLEDEQKAFQRYRAIRKAERAYI